MIVCQVLTKKVPRDCVEKCSESDEEKSCGNGQEAPWMCPLICHSVHGDQVTVNFDSEFRIGEVMAVKSDKVKISFVHPRNVEKSLP